MVARAVLRVGIAIAAACLSLAAHSQATNRVALVIGNADYKVGKLANPVNDARAMAARLKTLGFDVILRENLQQRDLGSVYREFRSKIAPGGVAVVFYAGHGLQIKGQNYFPAVDSRIDGEEDVPLQSLNLGTLLDNMEEAKAGVSLVFLDACRDNPYARRFRSASRGLAKVEASSGTLIHYATRPGSVAADGVGRNGTYTEELLAQISEPGMPVELMLKRVTNRVVEKTSGKQEPWMEGSLRGDFYFVGGAPAIQAQASARAPKGRFDGKWDLTVECPEHQDAKGYTRSYGVEVVDGALKGQGGVQGEPTWFRIEGRIEADGSARLEAQGITSNPRATVGGIKSGTPYSYPVPAQFSDSRGSGRRTKARPCELTFVRR